MRAIAAILKGPSDSLTWGKSDTPEKGAGSDFGAESSARGRLILRADNPSNTGDEHGI
jgi:hypothetical protein